MTAHVSVSEKIISLWAVTDEEHNILRCHEDDVLSIHRAIFSIYKDQDRLLDAVSLNKNRWRHGE